ncbi:DUF5985 family protein [Vulgatibacter sp.]|uniref:DUF5985 family protein n=1 Tax=Vulgatibacter sp. TaxID=1971226 RepID=UPI003569B9F8
MTPMVLDMLNGAIIMASFAAGLFFLRFWRESHDRLFAAFALAFWILCLNWLLLAFVGPEYEARTYLYVLRLAAFLLIIAAIVDKNRKRGRG